MSEIRTHALLGGSSAHRWTNCPGSCFYIKDLPPEEPSEHAIKGTKQHDICENYLRNFLDYKINGENVIEIKACTDEQYERACFYRDSVWTRVLNQSVTGKAYGFEDKFTLNEDLEMSGFVDFWTVFINERAKRKLSIVDYKDGIHEVEAEKNPQLAFYLVCARQELQNHGKDIDIAEGFIIQPSSKIPIKSVVYTPKDLDTWKKKFYAAAEIIFIKKKPKFKTGDWCFFCPAKSICLTYSKELHTKTALKLVDPVPDSLPTPEKLSDETLAKIITNYDVIKNFIDACYSHCLARHKQGKPLPGLKVVEGASRRKWKENADSTLPFYDKYGIDCTERKLKGIGIVEKLLKEFMSKEEITNALAPFTEKTTPSLTLVPITDERLEVKSNLDLLD